MKDEVASVAADDLAAIAGAHRELDGVQLSPADTAPTASHLAAVPLTA